MRSEYFQKSERVSTKCFYFSRLGIAPNIVIAYHTTRGISHNIDFFLISGLKKSSGGGKDERNEVNLILFAL